jgi:hypothetical protein
MLKYFILAVLCLILYQFFSYVLEGLDGEADANTGDSSAGETAVGDNTTATPSTSSATGGGESNNNNNGCGLSLTDRNVFLLNDRVNNLQTQYTDLSGNMAILNRQMEDLMKQNENAASEMVGNEPLDISTGGNDMPEIVGGDTTTTTDNTNANETAMTSAT